MASSSGAAEELFLAVKSQRNISRGAFGEDAAMQVTRPSVTHHSRHRDALSLTRARSGEPCRAWVRARRVRGSIRDGQGGLAVGLSIRDRRICWKNLSNGGWCGGHARGREDSQGRSGLPGEELV